MSLECTSCFNPKHDRVTLEGKEFRFELVRIVDVDIDCERYNKLHIVTENHINHQECDYEIHQNDNLYKILSWFGIMELSKLKGRITYKLIGMGEKDHGLILGFMKTSLDQFKLDQPIYYFIREIKN